MARINASIVLYQNDKKQVSKAINSFLNTGLDVKLYLLDNSPNQNLMELASVDKRIEYIFNNANLGFGKAHNIALRISVEDKGARYHIVLNPDVYFDKNVLEDLVNYAERHSDVGLMMPKVLYPDGEIQYLCKLLPTPIHLFGRRFLNFYPIKNFINKKNEVYELRFTGYDKVMNIPYLSGSFMFLRVEALKNIGIFDESFFMYLEDIDLSRRLFRKYKTIYYPEVRIYHIYMKESYKNKKLLIYHIESAVKYFNKWGWIYDNERDEINRMTLNKLRFSNK